MVRLYWKGSTEMKLKVTAKSKERDIAGKGNLCLDSMLYVLCSMLFALYALLFVPYSYCDTSTNLMSDESNLQQPALDVTQLQPGMLFIRHTFSFAHQNPHHHAARTNVPTIRTSTEKVR